MKIIRMSLKERLLISDRHNRMIQGDSGKRYLELYNEQVDQIILDLYGLRKITDDALDLTFAVEDDKKYMMYLLRGLQ